MKRKSVFLLHFARLFVTLRLKLKKWSALARRLQRHTLTSVREIQQIVTNRTDYN
jgi:hypothetical protein